MRVIHLKRTFLLPTETFVYTQLSQLPREKAIVLARDACELDRFLGVSLYSFSFTPQKFSKGWSNFNYRGLRRMTRFEQDFYIKKIYELQPDILHAHFAVDAAYFSNVTRQLDLPMVVSCYGYDVSSFPTRYFGLGSRYLQSAWQNARLILAMTEDMRQDLLKLGCPANKIRIHYHGINLSRFKYCERDSAEAPIRILFVGNLSDRKGVEDVLSAFARIASQYSGVQLRYVGSGQLRARLEQLTLSWGLEGRVSFAGFVRHEELPVEFNNAHIFCHPSRMLKSGDKEGIPGTIVEAMATGLPVVTTRHAGIPEMVRDGVDGFIVNERDVPAIALALSSLIDQKEERSRMGRNAAKQVQQKADSVHLTAELEHIYDEVT